VDCKKYRAGFVLLRHGAGLYIEAVRLAGAVEEAVNELAAGLKSSVFR
jgi:hypothetical protein